MTVIPIIIGGLGTVARSSIKGSGELGNNRTSEDHPNCSIVEIGQNTEKSPGDL